MPKLQLSEQEGGSMRFHLTIPTQYVRLLGWKKGIELAIVPGKEDRTLLLKEMPKVEVE